MSFSLCIRFILLCIPFLCHGLEEGVPLFYWQEQKVNFGDELSRVLVERIVGSSVRCYNKRSKKQDKKLLAVGSILYFANEGDLIWGSGVHGKTYDKKYYDFHHLDVRAVRGPITRKFLQEQLGIACPEVYGDPALLFPYFFPEFKRKKNPSIDVLIIPHYADEQYFPKSDYENVVYTSEPWQEIIRKILDSKFVVSSTLHGLILAESYGIPARVLHVSDSPHNLVLKYQDYFLGTGRSHFSFATTVEEAIRMGGEAPPQCDLARLYAAFPFEFWPDRQFKQPNFGLHHAFY